MSGTLFIITAPSGAGKTTLVRSLLRRDHLVRLSISYTTREPRPGERDGNDYHFVDMQTFKALRDAGEFLEWAEVHGNYYATSKVWIKGQIDKGHDILLEIDWQGAQQVRAQWPESLSIFILPPSRAELERRLRHRASDSAEQIARRIADSRIEIGHAAEFDFIVINDDFATAINDLRSIFAARRLRCEAQLGRHANLLDDLLKPA